MCGLIGHVVDSQSVPDRQAVIEGSKAIAHRGPDASGLIEDTQICFAHRRLSIIDLQGSQQPWSSDCGRYHMVFNGEIYNYLELQSDLKRCGFHFKSQGDTEVFLKLFQQHGYRAFSMVNGMFAVAIWDTHRRELVLARDRIGKKPLYYAKDRQQLAFSSELSGLSGFTFINRSIDSVAVHDFFAHQFIGGEKSIYSGIRKLLPGHYLVWQQDRCDLSRYWSIPIGEEISSDEQALCEELKSLFDDAVRIRLRSDVQLGAFLSGGIDSAVVASSIRQQGYALSTHTVGFTESSFDESQQAAETAAYLGTEHHTYHVDIPLDDTLSRCLRAFGEPYADPSAVPTWHLCEQTSKDITVALSGDGVDECFGGYRRYLARNWLSCYHIVPAVFRQRLLSPMIGALPEGSGYFADSSIKKLKLFDSLSIKQSLAPGDCLAQTFNYDERHRLLLSSRYGSHDFDIIKSYSLGSLDPVTQMMLADQMSYLPEDILTKVDRMSMQHGLEVRSPFLDYRLVEFAARLPLRYKVNGRQQKVLLKQCFRNDLPVPVLNRRKHGFAVPLASWFRSQLRESFEGLMSMHCESAGLDKPFVRQLWDAHQGGSTDHGFRLWSIYVYLNWYDNQAVLS